MVCKKFTIVELLISISLSTIVFIVLMSCIISVTIATRDIMAEYSMNQYLQITRNALLHGEGSTSGTINAENFTNSGDTLNYKYFSTVGTNYSFSRKDSDYKNVKIVLNDKVTMNGTQVLLGNVTIRPNSVKVEKLNDREKAVYYSIQKKFGGKTYSIDSVLKVNNFIENL